MALYTPLSNDELETIAGRYGLPVLQKVVPEPKGSINTNYHLWSGGERYFLRLSEGKVDAEVAFEAQVLSFLEEAMFPAVRLFLTLDGSSHVPVRGRQAMLFGYCPGEEVTRLEARPTHCLRVGEQLGRLHDLAAGFAGDRSNPFGPEWVALRIGELEPDAGGDEAVRAALPLLRRELEEAQRLPSAPRGLVHGDLFADNVLWVGDRVSALLDWEMACVETFAYDLGVVLNAWCYTDRFEKDRVAALLSGYRSKTRLRPETLEGLYSYTRYVALRFTVSRIHSYHLAQVGEDRLTRKEWSQYRERLLALQQMGEGGFGELLGR